MSVHEDTATLCFHTEDHAAKLVRRLHAQARAGTYHDVTLRAHDVTLRAHRSVLAAHSAYFEALLSGRWTNTAALDLSHLVYSGETLTALVRFMYTGKVVITKDNIEELLNMGTHLFMEDIRGTCSKYLLANLAPKNCLVIWQLAETYRLQEVAAMCRAVTKSRFHDYLSKRKDTLDLDQAFLEKIILEGLFEAVPRQEVLRFVQAWQQHGNHARMLSRNVLDSISVSASDFADVAMSVEQGGVSEVELSIKLAVDSTEINGNLLMDLQEESEFTEAIFGYVVVEDDIHNKYEDAKDFYVYMYNRSQNSWRFLNRFHQATWSFLLQANHIGFHRHEAVYDGGIRERSALVDFQQNTFRTISFPNTTTATRRMFCFDTQVFLLEDHVNDNHTINHTLYLLEESQMNWQKLLQFDIAELFPGFQTGGLLSYTVVSQPARAFIWAQDGNIQCSGPFWMSLQRSSTNRYSIKALERQPLTKEDLRLPTPFSLRGWKHATFKLIADSEKIHAYREQTLGDSSLNFDLLLTYDQRTNSWQERKDVSIALPVSDMLPIDTGLHLGSSSGRGFVQVDRACPVQSHIAGAAYIIEKLCPFVVRMWTCHINSGCWQQLTPPPIESICGFRCFHVVTAPKAVLSQLGTDPVYHGIQDDAPHSPMFYWDLRLADQLSDIKLQTTIAQRLQFSQCQPEKAASQCSPTRLPGCDSGYLSDGSGTSLPTVNRL